MDQETIYKIARAAASNSTCLRRQYGAVIVQDGKIVSTGTNGAPKGEKTCIQGGLCQRQADDSAHGSDYSNCKSVHAEMNALIYAIPEDLEDAVMYLVGYENGKEIAAKPCYICEKMIKQVGIKVITRKV